MSPVGSLPIVTTLLLLLAITPSWRQMVTFAYTEDTQSTTHYGLIAEDLATVYPELVTRAATGDIQTVKYHEIIPMLLNELQSEHREVTMLRQELAELRALIRQLAK